MTDGSAKQRALLGVTKYKRERESGGNQTTCSVSKGYLDSWGFGLAL